MEIGRKNEDKEKKRYRQLENIIFFVGTAIGGGQIFSASYPLIKAKPIKWQPDFFSCASFLNGNDYLEFAFRFNILPIDTGYPAAGEKNIPQNSVAGKKNIAQVKRCVIVNSKGLRCNHFLPSPTLWLDICQIFIRLRIVTY